jgi:hypothetical protein
LGAHGQYGEDFYNNAFGGRDFSGTTRIAAASCNEDFGLYSPLEKVARKNPDRYVYGIRPDATDVSWNMPQKSGGGLDLHFDPITEGRGTGVVPENVMAVGRYDPVKDKLIWRPLPDSKVREWLSGIGIDYRINPAATSDSSLARSLGNAVGASKQVGTGLALNLVLPEGAEVPAGLLSSSSLITANLYGGQAVLATESLIGMSAGVSYSAAGAMTLGGAFAAAAGGVAFAGTGVYQVVRQSPQLGYAPENGYSTGYLDNFAEMYCFWCQ